MKKSNYIKEEFKRIFGKRSVLISVGIVLLVPLVYAMIMLSPKWGPQDNIDNLPVAVVNNDAGANSDGEVVNIGDELVDNLEANRTLGWEFVSSEEAEQGMDGMKYYMKIEVPEDFSEKALTVLDDNPDRPELKFTQNEGLHYMASQVTDQAIETIKGQLSAQITETYVQTVVDELGGVSEGFNEAADGADQINDGSTQLKDGSEEILSSLIEKSPDISQLADGAEELNEGTYTLKDSLVTKQGDISTLAEGSQELNDGTAEILSNLNNKSSDIAELAAGANDLSEGANELKSGTGDLKSGSSDLKEGADELKSGSTELKKGSSDLKEGTVELKEGANNANAGGEELLDALNTDDGRVGAGVTELAEGTKTAKSGVEESIESLKMLHMMLENLSETPDDEDAYLELINGLNTITSILDSSIKEAENEKIPELERLVEGGETLRKGLADDDGEFKSGLIELSNGLDDLSVGANDLNSGASELNEGAKELSAGATELDDGVATLKAGAGELASGAGELDEGANDLSAGATQVADGNQTVKSGWGDLQDGATELHDGSTQIADGNQTVKSGWQELTEGATELHDGSTQINEGNTTVREGWTTLTDGVTQVDDGLIELLDGSEELHEGLEDGAEQAGALDPQEDNVTMFAEPVVADAEVINSFPFYRDANAPYVITLALFVGVLAMSFVVPYRKPAILPPTATTWFTGKVGKLAVLAIAQALIISLYSLLVLKVEVHSSLLFILFSVWVSLTFLMIVLFLVVLAGNIGRFAALAFAVLQLSTTGSDLPIHMLPEGLRNLSVFLPFTYSIDGFKNIVTLGSTSTVWANMGVLFIYLATFGILAAVVFYIRFRRLDQEMETEEDAGESTI